MKNKKDAAGAAAALAANMIFGCSFIFSKKALSAAHPLIILSVRFTVAFIVMSLLALCGKFRLNLNGKPKKRLLIIRVIGRDNRARARSGHAFIGAVFRRKAYLIAGRLHRRLAYRYFGYEHNFKRRQRESGIGYISFARGGFVRGGI